MDFGIAKESGRSGGLTAVGEVMGTPEYMSPEQCRGNPLDFRSDIYSLGVVVYEIFTGEVPFRGDSVMSTLLKQVEAPPPLSGPVADRIPRAVVDILRKALAKNSADRFATAAEMAAALRTAQQESRDHEQVFEAAGPTRVLERVAEHASPAVSEATSEPVSAPRSERRRDTRLPISLDLMLRRLGAGGSVLQEERTVTDNIGARGARVLTTMSDLAEGHTVSIQEVGGSFGTRSVVRHVSTGVDRIRRLGVEFLDRQAPDHLVPSDDSKPAASRRDERRKHSRLAISVDVILRRLSPGGALLREERTVVDNIGRRGARVLTTMTDLAVGDVVSIQEVGSDFQTRAIVRNVVVGTIRRIGIEFLDHTAPDRLLPVADNLTRAPRPRTGTGPSERAPAPPPPPPQKDGVSTKDTQRRRQEIRAAYEEIETRTHFEVLGIPRASGPTQVKEAYFRLSREFHPDAARDPGVADLAHEIEAVFIRVNEAYQVLIDPESRSRYENILGPSRRKPPSVQAPTPPSVPEARPAPVTPAPPPPVTPAPAAGSVPVASVEANLDTPTRLAEQILQDARKLIASEKYWDAIQKLEGATDLAKGTKANQSVRILLAQTTGRNPKWRKQAEEALLAVLREDPRCIEAYVALGGLYKAAGLTSRALAQIRKALELDPSHARARASLEELSTGR
jgi:hypothetical protein